MFDVQNSRQKHSVFGERTQTSVRGANALRAAARAREESEQPRNVFEDRRFSTHSDDNVARMAAVRVARMTQARMSRRTKGVDSILDDGEGQHAELTHRGLPLGQLKVGKERVGGSDSEDDGKNIINFQ